MLTALLESIGLCWVPTEPRLGLSLIKAVQRQAGRIFYLWICAMLLGIFPEYKLTVLII